MPRLTPLQWLIAAAFLAFYGFAVFALTRDYYLRHPPSAPVASAATSAALGQSLRAAAGSSALPPELMDASPALLSQEADRLFAAQRFAEAATLYRRALEQNPADAGISNDLGLALHYAGNTGAGLAVLRDGADAAPEFQRIWLSLGFVALQAGDQTLARRALTRAETLDPETDIGAEATRLLGELQP
ncbi:tetratricopeptide repeat protein [Thiohalocapsa marina]|uniref:Tetratricopeptide repeat protein n=1 Tax=Thiohalocapsa marina TaxID=424902 RepID=A0A5M8FUN4_9GAMM|nr:tetratricopeptide repeat protein [Thiohalocapsa marina]KAA6187483.1 tetratricopeptide repeat protein [Thiohalocapsa marina]